MGRLVIEQESRKQSKLPTQGVILFFSPVIPGCRKLSLQQITENTLQKEQNHRR